MHRVHEVVGRGVNNYEWASNGNEFENIIYIIMIFTPTNQKTNQKGCPFFGFVLLIAIRFLFFSMVLDSSETRHDVVEMW